MQKSKIVNLNSLGLVFGCSEEDTTTVSVPLVTPAMSSYNLSSPQFAVGRLAVWWAGYPLDYCTRETYLFGVL